MSITTLTKVAAASAISLSLLAAASFPAAASAPHHSGPSRTKIVKKVKASTRGGIRTGGSNSHASVNNGINVNVGGGSNGGGRAVISRGGSNGGNNNNNHKNNNGGGKKKVVRVKRVVRNVDNSYVDNSYVDNSYYNDESNVDNSVNNDIEQTITNKTKYIIKNPSSGCDANCYEDNWGDYSNDCGCYNKPSTTKVINNNNNSNDNYNKQVVDISY